MGSNGRPKLKPGVKVRDKKYPRGIRLKAEGVVSYGPSTGKYYDSQDDSVHVRWNNGDSGWIDAKDIEVII